MLSVVSLNGKEGINILNNVDYLTDTIMVSIDGKSREFYEDVPATGGERGQRPQVTGFRHRESGEGVQGFKSTRGSGEAAVQEVPECPSEEGRDEGGDGLFATIPGGNRGESSVGHSNFCNAVNI